MKKVAISGGFDPIHKGHIRLIKEARKLGDYLIVILNNDNWLKKKKGKIFMDEDERKEILEAIGGVNAVFVSIHPQSCIDMSVSKEIEILLPDIFANGGDRTSKNTPEKEICRKLNIPMIFNVGGTKVQSSSELLKDYAD
jgi:cytidyltransferase-like protein